jgi:hypothetical protein
VLITTLAEVGMLQYNIRESQLHFSEFAQKSTLDRKCG